MKKILKILLAIFLVIVIVVIGYVAYLFIQYSRIPDNTDIVPQNAHNDAMVTTDTVYTVVTQNIGFGAYTKDFTFFMDGGKLSRAKSKESVIDCVNQSADTVLNFSPDFVLFQEVDTDSTRSHHVDQSELLKSRFKTFSNTFAINYHSAYLAYPFTSPHGASNSGILTLSKYDFSTAKRRSLPISESITKFLDLDRCYSMTRIPVDNGKNLTLINLHLSAYGGNPTIRQQQVQKLSDDMQYELENGKELLIYNVHLSAYGGNDEIRTAQMNMLLNDMKEEYLKGNYCVCGGDFNHDFTGDSTQRLNGGSSVDFGWAQPFPENLLPKELSRCINYSDEKLSPTCRNCDIPYEEGNFTIIVDGFLVSQNVTAVSVENVHTGFVYSDHNPVVLKFSLK